MGLLTVLQKNKYKDKELRILFLGLDNAGKTTCLKKLLKEPIDTISPTFGFSIKTLVYGEFSLNLWDVGGQRSLRPYWRNYFEKTDAIVWVVDSSDYTRLDDGREELWMLLQEELAGASLLVFANKQDVPGALTPEQIKQKLCLEDIHTHSWRIQASSARTGENLTTGLDWLVKDIASRLYYYGIPNGDSTRSLTSALDAKVVRKTQLPGTRTGQLFLIVMTIRAILIFNNHGNPRVSKFYSHLAVEQQQALIQLIYQLVSRRDDKKMCNFLDAPELTALLPPPSVGAQDQRWRTSAHTSQSRTWSGTQEENVSDPWISTSNTPTPAVSKKHRRWRPDDELRVIYRHYATLYFVLVVDQSESELGILDLIQVIVESLDRCFENVCELDLIFHFDQVHAILDQIVQGGLVLDTNISEIVSGANAVNQARKASVRSGAGALGAFGGAPTMSSYLAPSSLVQNLSSPSLGSWSDSRSGMDLLQQVGSYYLKLTNSNVHRHRDP